MTTEQLLDDIYAQRVIARSMGVRVGEQMVHVEVLPPQEARLGVPSRSLPDVLAEALSRTGISQLYTHQVEALERVRAGENVVVVTPTSSGKTLCYNLPVLETMLGDRSARALYLYPINALVNDQLKTLLKLDLLLGRQAVGVARYTAGQNAAQRKAIRARQPNILLTNPEMLHLSFLLWHQQWEALWRNLRYVVIDEIHTYRGVFGANMAQVFRRLRAARRLRRVAAHYGSTP